SGARHKCGRPHIADVAGCNDRRSIETRGIERRGGMRHLVVHVDEAAPGTKPLLRKNPGSHSLPEVIQAVHEVVGKGFGRGHSGTEQNARCAEREVSCKEPARLGVVSNKVYPIKADSGGLKAVAYGPHREAAGIADSYVSDAG